MAALHRPLDVAVERWRVIELDLAPGGPGVGQVLERTRGRSVQRADSPGDGRPPAGRCARACARGPDPRCCPREVEFDYAPALYGDVELAGGAPPRVPYLLEPSLATRALYLIGHDIDRGAVRTFKVERISNLAILLQTFGEPEADVLDGLRGAWDIIADEAATEVVLRFAPTVAARVMEATRHPSQSSTSSRTGRSEWRAVVSGTVEIKLGSVVGSDVEVLAPAALRAEVADAPEGRCPGPG